MYRIATRPAKLSDKGPPDHPEVARALLESTRDDDPVLRRAAYTALASLLDPPRAVIERLTEAMQHEPDAKSRRTAAMALERLEGSPSAPS